MTNHLPIDLWNVVRDQSCLRKTDIRLKKCTKHLYKHLHLLDLATFRVFKKENVNMYCHPFIRKTTWHPDLNPSQFPSIRELHVGSFNNKNMNFETDYQKIGLLTKIISTDVRFWFNDLKALEYIQTCKSKK